MTLVLDLLLGLVFLLALIAGWRNGLPRELCAVGGLIGGLWAGLRLTGWALSFAPAMVQRFPFIHAVGFLLIFFVAYFLMQLLGLLASKMIEGKEPSSLSRALALVPGAIRGLGLVVVLAGGTALLAPKGNQVLGDSKVLPHLTPLVLQVARVLPEDIGGRLRRRWHALPFPGVPRVDPANDVEAARITLRALERTAQVLSPASALAAIEARLKIGATELGPERGEDSDHRHREERPRDAEEHA